MKIESFKFVGHSCFRDHWSGFDQFKPINVVIGRNNTGKSRLLDLIEASTKSDYKKIGWDFLCVGKLTEADLKRQFPESTTGGQLGGNHWRNHGRLFVGADVEWQIDKSGSVSQLTVLNGTANDPLSEPRREQIKRILDSAKPPLLGKKFIHLLADRNISPEAISTDMSLRPDGGGATNIVRRYLTSSSVRYPRDTISGDLRKALNEIFGSDGSFTEITIQLHDESKNEFSDKWEIYLGEAHKGIVPLSASGSGLKTIFLVLLNLIARPEIEGKPKSDYVFAFEELENNLHPAVQRRLLSYLEEYATTTGALIFLTTHSSVALDLFGPSKNAQIVHVSHDGKSARSRVVNVHYEQIGVIAELGAKPSDLLQSNGIIWVEGPSDAIYINRWIELISDGKWKEGRHYLCAFYGGALLSRTQFTSREEAEDELVNLFNVNPNLAVVCDGDRDAPRKRLKGRVTRIKREVERIPRGFVWVTDAKEIENYLYVECLEKALGKRPGRDPNQYEAFFSKKQSGDSYLETALGRKSVDKIELALSTVPHMSLDGVRKRFDLEKQMNALVKRIAEWNA